MTVAASLGIGAKLAEIERDRGGLPRFMQLFRELADIEEETGRKALVPEPSLTDEAVRQCHAEGKPLLLAVDNLTIDWSLVSAALRQVQDVFARYTDLLRAPSGSPGALQSDLIDWLLDGSVVQGRLKREEAPSAEPTTKECPHCLSEIPIKATRCPNCTSHLELV